MPLPSPKGKEKQNDFISRCMGDNTMGKDFKDQKQRAAVCYSQWEKAKASADVVLGSEGNETLIFNEVAQERYGGKKRSNLKDGDFLFPETRSFPIVTPQDVRDAISNFGRMKGDMTYDTFIKKLYRKAKSKGQEFVDAIPESTKKEHKLTAADIGQFKVGDYVTNVNPNCMHYKSEGIVQKISELEDNMGCAVAYKCTNDGPNWKRGDILTKTEAQLQKIATASEESLEDYKMDFYHMSLGSLNSIKKHAENIIAAIDDPMVKENLTEPWLQGKIAITEDYMLAIHNYIMFVEENKAEAKEILATKIISSEGEYECEDCGYEGEKADKCPKCGSPNYKEEMEDEEDDTELDASGEDLNEDNFYCPEESEYVTAEEVAFSEDDVVEYDIAMKRPGLWENIRRKKKREGKNYKPAKPGDKDRPSKDAWEKAQGSEYQGRKVKLNKPFRTPGGPKKFSVYVKNDKGNVVKVNFGDPNMKIKKNIPARRKSFRARHNCDNPGPKWKARYWACKSW